MVPSGFRHDKGMWRSWASSAGCIRHGPLRYGAQVWAVPRELEETALWLPKPSRRCLHPRTPSQQNSASQANSAAIHHPRANLSDWFVYKYVHTWKYLPSANSNPLNMHPSVFPILHSLHKISSLLLSSVNAYSTFLHVINIHAYERSCKNIAWLIYYLVYTLFPAEY